MTNTVIWEGPVFGRELSAEEPGYDSRSKRVRAVYDGSTNVYFEVEDGVDRMNITRWIPITLVPKSFIIAAAKLMSKNNG